VEAIPRPDAEASAFDHPDRRVLSVRRDSSLDPNGSIHLRGSINSVLTAWGSLSWHFDIPNILVTLRKHLSLIFIIDSSYNEIGSDSKCIYLSDCI
jgi:hypothetical protein